METDGVLAEISTENFQECINGTIEEIIRANQQNHDKKMMKADAN